MKQLLRRCVLGQAMLFTRVGSVCAVDDEQLDHCRSPISRWLRRFSSMVTSIRSSGVTVATRASLAEQFCRSR